MHSHDVISFCWGSQAWLSFHPKGCGSKISALMSMELPHKPTEIKRWIRLSVFVLPTSKRIRPRLVYSNYRNLMEIPTDIDRLTGRKAKNCRKKLNEGEKNSAIGRKEASQKNPGKTQGISVMLNINNLFLELQVVLGTSSAQLSLCMFLNK